MTTGGLFGSGALAAGGTRARPGHEATPAGWRRLRLILELGLLFVAAPLLLKHAMMALHIPLLFVLPPLLLLVLIYLLLDDTFHVATELTHGLRVLELISVLALFAVVGAAIAAFVAWQMPDRFLGMPRYRPDIWQKVMIFYPLLSVLPQELIYRSFFFHRYGPLFGTARWLAILVNGLLFGFSHILFGTWIAVALTVVLGCLLAWRYQRTRSLWAVFIEHALYGCLIFTVGLGYLFFTGIPSLG